MTYNVDVQSAISLAVAIALTMVLAALPLQTGLIKSKTSSREGISSEKRFDYSQGSRYSEPVYYSKTT